MSNWWNNAELTIGPSSSGAISEEGKRERGLQSSLEVFLERSIFNLQLCANETGIRECFLIDSFVTDPDSASETQAHRR